MQNFTADSMVLKSKTNSDSADAKFSNQGLQIAADCPKSLHINIKLLTPNFPGHVLLVQGLSRWYEQVYEVSWQSYTQILS